MNRRKNNAEELCRSEDVYYCSIIREEDTIEVGKVGPHVSGEEVKAVMEELKKPTERK